MTVSAFGPEGHDHLGPVAAKRANEVAEESVLDRLDLFDFLQRAIRIVECFQEGDAELAGRSAKFELADVRQLAEVAGCPPIPESGAAASQGNQVNRRSLGAVTRDGRGAAKALVVGVWHHDHQTLPFTLHSEHVSGPIIAS